MFLMHKINDVLLHKDTNLQFRKNIPLSNQTAMMSGGNIGEETTSFDGGKTAHLMNESSTRIISDFTDI